MLAPTIKYPAKFEPFLHPKRYKVAYGGRGSAKSWSIATFLVLLQFKELRKVCQGPSFLCALVGLRMDRLKLRFCCP